jgi:HSP20 family protein
MFPSIVLPVRPADRRNAMTRQTAIQATNNNTVQVHPTHTPPTRHSNENEGWSYVPSIDVLESTGEFTIVCDAPGLTIDDINLTFDSGMLHIDGRVNQRYHNDVSFLRQEYGVGDFYRQVTLGRIAEFIDGEKISAEYSAGVLTVHLPKFESAKPRKIQVRAAE